jgi:hypothetical protein
MGGAWEKLPEGVFRRVIQAKQQSACRMDKWTLKKWYLQSMKMEKEMVSSRSCKWLTMIGTLRGEKLER